MQKKSNGCFAGSLEGAPFSSGMKMPQAGSGREVRGTGLERKKKDIPFVDVTQSKESDQDVSFGAKNNHTGQILNLTQKNF